MIALVQMAIDFDKEEKVQQQMQAVLSLHHLHDLHHVMLLMQIVDSMIMNYAM